MEDLVLKEMIADDKRNLTADEIANLNNRFGKLFQKSLRGKRLPEIVFKKTFPGSVFLIVSRENVFHHKLSLTVFQMAFARHRFQETFSSKLERCPETMVSGNRFPQNVFR